MAPAWTAWFQVYRNYEYISTIDIISLNVFEEVGSVIFRCTSIQMAVSRWISNQDLV